VRTPHRLPTLFGLLAITAGAGATNTRPELEAVMADLLAWLPGEYSSAAQLELERRFGAPPDGEHYDWYRIFARVDAPHIGEHVIYGQLHVGDKDQPIVPGTQVLYIVSIDEARGAVSVNGRRIKDPRDYQFAHEDPEKLKTIAIDPDYGGNCDFRWRRHGTQIVGRLAQPDEAAIDGNCTMTSKTSGVTMTWDAEWVLNPDELWIYDNGYIDGKDLFVGREDRTHIRLTRVHRYACTVSAPRGAAARTIELHDGGGEAELTAAGPRLRLLRAPRPDADGALRESTVLSVADPDSGDEIASEQAAGRPARIAVEAPAARASCVAER
jgi:hypothetical protein